ncbi:putative histone-lysine N-methyltransferase PRDM7 [Amphibalanus amphitrite]|uniref:Putative histone-lysine N-methyltransferase PRDM7 n=1 Tax=Amphibalanus amphitrite TaxID=1232801 RepID=A0A6A4WLB4_AMPAM|nr:putative histone-lysine N-methyltransferase PRDM7 [Amphibalanus amphitrite]
MGHGPGESEPPPSMRAASMTPVESKWSREGSADGDEEWGPSECVRRSQRRRNTTPIDSGSEGILEPTVKEEIKMEVTSPRVERPSSPSVSDEDLLSDRALQSVVKEEKLRCRSPSSSEDFIGFTEVDRDRRSFEFNFDVNETRSIHDLFLFFFFAACAEGVFIKSQRMVINYRDVDGLDDGNIFCDVCCRDFDGECPVHGPLKVIPDTKARPGIGDAERDLKTLPSSLSSGQSKNPASGNGVFAENDLPARQRLGPYEGILTTEQGQARTTGYRWQMKKGERVHHLVNAEDPSCSNWLRRVNCARSEEEQNLVAFQYRGQIYFRTSKPVPRGSELLVYYGDDSARELTVHSERSGEAVTSSPAGPSSSASFLLPSILTLKLDTLKPDKADVHRYLQMISAMDMKQLVSCPTRPASGSLIDHVLVRQSDDITATRVEPCSWSDHDLVIAETTLQRERRRPAEVTIRSTRDLVPDALCLELLVSDWSAVYSATDPADKWKAWLAVWSPVIDRHMPEKKIRPRHSPAPWITENDELQTMMRERDLADAERRAQPADEQAAQRYRLCRNRVKSAQISAKSDFFLTSYRRSRRTTWKDIRRFLISPRAGASSASSSPSGPRWADRLNEYFASVGPSVAAALEEAQRVTEPLPPRPPRVVSGAFRVHPVTLSELSAAVKHVSENIVWTDT